MAMSEERWQTRKVDSSSMRTDDKSTNMNPDNQDYWYYCEHSYIVDDTDTTHDKDKKNKKTMHRYHKDKRHLKKMDSLICNAYYSLKEYFDPNLYSNHQIPYDLFQQCKGIIFLRIWKAGVVLGGIGGTGIVLMHSNIGWSNPCAVSIGGIQLGLQIGVERVDDVLLLNDDTALNMFIEKGHFKLGVDASIAAGPFGRDANSGIAISGGQSKSIYSYSFAKGAYIGLSLEGGALSVDNSVNEEFYNKKLSIKDIFYTDNFIAQSDDFLRLKQLLNNYSLNQRNINEPYIQSNVYPSNTNFTTSTNVPITNTATTTTTSTNPNPTTFSK